ncbi:hypothetical protein I312_103364 [Cryptococcus bacillisporus CA1280]|uniref:Uncharacterized protein n=1 Tax=Cryptococcus bacillisporus CA1280 TaxID=1296109 RepID=A0A0D0UGE8_CRYGA|nr:hypothetical protein I312_03086 [Cryptococcus bacillisporus CA1280]
MSNSKPYVSSSGTVGAQPLTHKISIKLSDFATLAYLFFETLVSPIVNPASWTDPTARPKSAGTGRPSAPGGGGGGRGGWGGGGGGGGSGGGGGRGFMTMGDLRGGGTVDGCRATCG